MRGVTLAVIVLCCACSDDPPDDETSPPAGCAVHEVAIDGGCLTVGVPPDACAEGFTPDALGCVPILPTVPCNPGTLGLPGETVCRPVKSCADGTWGDIPVDATTQFVDASFVGASNGSDAAPWTTIDDAINAAAPGALIAVAAGQYGKVVIADKTVRLWGRCPELVFIDSPPPPEAGIGIARANGTEIHGVSVSGDSYGVYVSDALDVLIDQVWLHDLAYVGVQVTANFGPASATIDRSLIERATLSGVGVHGSVAVVQNTVVRQSQREPAMGFGRGISAQTFADAPSELTVLGSVVEDNLEWGIYASGSSLTVDRTVVQRTRTTAAGNFGRGIGAQINATATITSSYIADNQEVGIFIGAASALLQHSVVRNTQPNATGGFGMGVSVRDNAHLDAFASWITANRLYGIGFRGATASIQDTAIDNTDVQQSDSLFGDGITLIRGDLTAPPAIGIQRSWIAGNARAGAATWGGTIALTGVVLECNGISLNGEQDETPFFFDDQGGNACRCEVDEGCAAQSSGLAPPVPEP